MNRELLTAVDARRKKQAARGMAHCLPALRYARDLVPLDARLDLHDAIREQLAAWENDDAEEANVNERSGLWCHDDYPACNPVGAQ